MLGLLYKTFYQMRLSLIVYLILNLVIGATCIIMCKTVEAPEDITFFILISLVLYFSSFVLAGSGVNEAFRLDEKHQWCSFVFSVPHGASYQIITKFIFQFVTFIVTFLICLASALCCEHFIETDMSIICKMLIMLLDIRIILSAIELPFVVRFGAAKGLTIKGIIIAILFFTACVYGLFGDISFLLGDDSAERMLKWMLELNINTACIKMCLGAAAAFLISCFISIKLYRKGAENYSE